MRTIIIFNMTKPEISTEVLDDLFNKIEIRIGTIKSVDRMEKSDKMLKLQVSFGDGNVKTVMTNIGNVIADPQDLVMVQLPFIMNLAPRKMMGVLSEAVIMVAKTENGKIEFEQYTDGAILV